MPGRMPACSACSRVATIPRLCSWSKGHKSRWLALSGSTPAAREHRQSALLPGDLRSSAEPLTRHRSCLPPYQRKCNLAVALPTSCEQSSDRLSPASVFEASAVGSRHDNKDLVRPRRVGYRHGYRVEVREGPGVVLVHERHVEARANRGDLRSTRSLSCRRRSRPASARRASGARKRRRAPFRRRPRRLHPCRRRRPAPDLRAA